MAKLAKLDLKHPSTAANAILAALDGMAIEIARKTVEGYLKQVSAGLDATLDQKRR
jgi:hypothetical protein